MPRVIDAFVSISPLADTIDLPEFGVTQSPHFYHGENGAMRSNLTGGLAAIALGFGTVGTFAATIDPSMLTTSDAALSSMQMPEGKFASGLSAIKTHQGNGLKDDSLVGVSVTGGATSDNLVQPEGEAWRYELRVLTGAFAEQQELTPPQGMQVNPNGFAAIKAATGQRSGSADLEGQLSSGGAAAFDSLVSPPSK